MEVVMSQNSINSQFQQYANTMYAAASRMMDKRNPQYEDKGKLKIIASLHLISYLTIAIEFI